MNFCVVVRWLVRILEVCLFNWLFCLLIRKLFVLVVLLENCVMVIMCFKFNCFFCNIGLICGVGVGVGFIILWVVLV